MKVLYAASEAVPLAKTGGLADVAGALPRAVAELGVKPALIMPAYAEVGKDILACFRTIAEFPVQLGWRNQTCRLLSAEIAGIACYLIDNDYYYKRGSLYGYDDEAERFVFFCFAVMEAVPHLAELPDIIHCHDWQTGMIPFLLRNRYGDRPPYRRIRTVFTVHNLQYQGVFSTEVLMDLLSAGPEWFTPETLEFYGGASCMKAGLLYADKLTTVSETYAREILTEAYGERLEGVLRMRRRDLVGIVNGIDTASFDPMRDPALAVPFGDSLADKRRNKPPLQRELGLELSEQRPLIGMVSRLADQKGFDLLERALEPLIAEGVQLAVLGSGDYRFEKLLRQAASAHPRRIAVRFGFDDALARRIYAGSDLYLMPSRFEPCGLSQLIALRYMSVPVVRETGGLADTVQPFDEYTGEGTGFRFRAYTPAALLDAVRRALSVYRQPALWAQAARNGAGQDFGWSRSARAYLDVYSKIATSGKESV